MNNVINNILKRINISDENITKELLENPIVYFANNKKQNDTMDKDIIIEVGLNGLGNKKNKINQRIELPKHILDNLPKPLTKEDYNLLKNTQVWDNLLVFVQEYNTINKEVKNLQDYIIPNVNIKYECPNKDGYLIPISAQTRSIDEPETIRYVCTTNPSHTFDPEDIELKGIKN